MNSAGSRHKSRSSFRVDEVKCDQLPRGALQRAAGFMQLLPEMNPGSGVGLSHSGVSVGC